MLTAETVDQAGDLLLPGTRELVRRGMRIEVAAAQPMRWRRVYQTATEQHAAQVRLGPLGELQAYVAGLPFPGVRANDDRAVRSRLPGTRSLASAVDIDGRLEASAFSPMALEQARRS